MRAVVVVAVSAAAVLALWLVLSQRQVPGSYMPEVAGVIEAEESLPGSSMRYVLTDGREITVDYANTTIVMSVGREVGDLLLQGSSPEASWVALLAPALRRSDLPIECYGLNGWGTDEGDWIQTDVGLRLRKAPGFDAGLLAETPGGVVPTPRVGMRYEAVQQVFCLNEEGLVTARR
jgi:hypothetical protein